MRETGSIRVEINGEDGGYYWIDHPGMFQGRKVFRISKSAVTDIHKEVDWNKVEEGTKIVVWPIAGCRTKNARLGYLAYYRESTDTVGFCETRNDVMRITHFPTYPASNAMFLADWLDKYGNGKDE